MLKKEAKDYLPLTEATYYILISLVTPHHGYGIMQDVDEKSFGEVKLGPGTLYGALKKLVKDKLITEIESNEGDRRKNYQITEFGKKVVKLEYARLKGLVESSKSIMETLEGK